MNTVIDIKRCDPPCDRAYDSERCTNGEETWESEDNLFKTCLPHDFDSNHDPNESKSTQPLHAHVVSHVF